MGVKQWAREKFCRVKPLAGWLDEAYETGKRVGRSELLSEIETRQKLLKIGRTELHLEKVAARAFVSERVPSNDRREYALRIIADNIGAALLPYIVISESRDRTASGLIRYDGEVKVVIDG